MAGRGQVVGDRRSQQHQVVGIVDGGRVALQVNGVVEIVVHPRQIDDAQGGEDGAAGDVDGIVRRVGLKDAAASGVIACIAGLGDVARQGDIAR